MSKEMISVKSLKLTSVVRVVRSWILEHFSIVLFAIDKRVSSFSICNFHSSVNLSYYFQQLARVGGEIAKKNFKLFYLPKTS